MKERITFNTVAQICLVLFTSLGFLLTALKLPAYGLVSNLLAQVFWIYSTYRSWKQANQVGAFINTIITTVIIVAGVINYWFLK
ncbi:MAG: hypothetical protein WCG55_03605 [bacterium]